MAEKDETLRLLQQVPRDPAERPLAQARVRYAAPGTTTSILRRPRSSASASFGCPPIRPPLRRSSDRFDPRAGKKDSSFSVPWASRSSRALF